MQIGNDMLLLRSALFDDDGHDKNVFKDFEKLGVVRCRGAFAQPPALPCVCACVGSNLAGGRAVQEERSRPLRRVPAAAAPAAGGAILLLAGQG